MQNQILQQSVDEGARNADEDARYQHDVAVALADPTAKSYADLFAKHPQFKDALSKSWETRDADAKQGDLRQLGGVHAALLGNKPDVAIALLQRRIAADKEAERDTSDDQQILDALQSGDPHDLAVATGMTGAAISAIVGPDKYSEAYGQLNKAGQKKRYVVGRALTDEDGTALYRDPDPTQYRTIKTADADGNPIDQVVALGGGGGDPASSGGGMPASLPDIVTKIAQIEGTGKNPRSSSVGVGQFTNGTWLATYKKNFPNTGETAAAILAKRNDPELASQMLTSLTKNNADALTNAGISPTADNIYLANFLDPSGATKLLSAPDNTPLSAVVSRPAIEANPTILGGNKTVGDLRQWSAQKMAGGGASSGASAGARVLRSGKPATAANAAIDDATVNFYAEKLAAGGKNSDLPTIGTGKAATAWRITILKRTAELQTGKGITGGESNLAQSDVKASTMALGQLQKTRSNVEGFERTFMLNVQQVEKLAPQGVGGSAPIFNRWIQAGRKNIEGGPAVSRFNVAVNTAANEYAKLASGASGGAVTSDSARHEAMEILNNAQTLPQLKAAIAQMKIDGHNRVLALNEQEARLRGNIRNAGAGAAGGPVRVRSVQEAQKLAPGTVFLTPDGRRKVR